MPRTVPPRPKAKCFLLTFLFIGRPISHPSFDQSKCQRLKVPVVLQLCASVASQGGNSMARKVAKSSHEATARWLIRVYLAAIAKPKNARTTTEQSTVPCGKRKHI